MRNTNVTTDLECFKPTGLDVTANGQGMNLEDQGGLVDGVDLVGIHEVSSLFIVRCSVFSVQSASWRIRVQ